MEALRFTGSGSEYFKIWIVNILLTIITMGIYYPWAKVRNRRYFYGNTNLADRNFEYHATGKQLLLGFIIGITLFVIYSFVTQIAPQFAGIFVLLFMLILPWLVWRSLMFNMKVTSFSNVHFSFKGSLKKAYIIFLGYPIMMYIPIVLIGILAAVLIPNLKDLNKDLLIGGGIILGLLVTIGYIYFIALIKKKSKEYIIGNSYYGQGAFSTELETKKFIGIYAKAFGIMSIIISIFTAIVYILVSTSGAEVNKEIILGGAYFGFLLSMLFVAGYVISRERAYIFSNTLLDDKIALESTLKARSFIWVMFSNFLMVMFTLGLAMPWAKVRMAKLMLNNTLVDTYLGFDEYITQQQNNVGALGEQIGEAFDVDIDVGF